MKKIVLTVCAILALNSCRTTAIEPIVTERELTIKVKTNDSLIVELNRNTIKTFVYTSITSSDSLYTFDCHKGDVVSVRMLNGALYPSIQPYNTIVIYKDDDQVWRSITTYNNTTPSYLVD